jgi:hypothetical protein
MHSSCATVALPAAIGTISPARRPSLRAAAALRWLSIANSSCAVRVICQRSATFSAVSPMLI